MREFLETRGRLIKVGFFAPLVGTGKYRATEDLLFAGGNVNAEVDCLDGERERQEEEREEVHPGHRCRV